MKATVEFLGKRVNLVISQRRYMNNNRVALVAQSDQGENFGVITVNDETVHLEPNEVMVKTWTENVGTIYGPRMRTSWVRQLLGQIPALKDTGFRVPIEVGDALRHAEAEVWTYVPEALPKE